MYCTVLYIFFSHLSGLNNFWIHCFNITVVLYCLLYLTLCNMVCSIHQPCSTRRQRNLWKRKRMRTNGNQVDWWIDTVTNSGYFPVLYCSVRVEIWLLLAQVCPIILAVLHECCVVYCILYCSCCHGNALLGIHFHSFGVFDHHRCLSQIP